MGPPVKRAPTTHVETRYYIDPQGNTSQRQVQVPDSPQSNRTAQPEYRYYRKPDGTVERRQVTPTPQAQAQAPAARVTPATAPVAAPIAAAAKAPPASRSSTQAQAPATRAAPAAAPVAAAAMAPPAMRPSTQAQRPPVYSPRPPGQTQQLAPSPQPTPQYAQRPPPQQTQRPPPRKAAKHPPRRGPRWTGKRVIKHVVVIAVIVLLLLWPTTIPTLQALVETIITGEPSIQFFPESAEFTLQRVNTLSSNSGIEYHINISEPFHIPGIHELRGLTTSPNPTREFVYKEQNWMGWDGNIPRSGGTASIAITYKMKLYSTTWEIDGDDSGSLSDVGAEYDKYLGTEWKITPSDPQVQALSKEIVGDETNVYEILLKIYLWLDDNLDYNTQRSSEPKSCSVTLADGNGDCDDQSILFASLARAAGVPVWLNLGIIYDPVRNYWGGHGWNNVYIPLKDGDHAIATVDIVNDQFLFRDPYHVSDYIDNGNGQDLMDYYTSWSYRYSSSPNGAPQVSSDEVYTILDIKTSGSIIYTKP